MEFYHDETIAAIATPAGQGAVGMIRLSGPDVAGVITRVCRRINGGPIESFKPRHSTLVHFIDLSGNFIDEGLVVFNKSPHSYTGEDTAELYLHGNPLLLRKFLMEIFRIDGVKPADPGEFTKRAFLNGKMDLTRAEAVRRVIESRSEFELMAGRRMLAGELTKTVNRFRSSLINLKADTEAEVDFSDEDLTYESRTERIAHIHQLVAEIDHILKTSEAALKIAGGYQIALAGIPNAGKSTLLNRLLGWDRAIVSPTAGTTRDYLSEELQLEGIAVRFVDTAGLRESHDDVEREGIRRSKLEIERSNLVLNVIDGSSEIYEYPDPGSANNTLYIVNKTDILNENWNNHLFPMQENVLFVSSVTGQGIDELKEMILKNLMKGDRETDPMIIEERHRYHFLRIRESLNRVPSLWEEGAPDEIVALEIDDALSHLGELTGTVSTEEILGRIFSRFCVGK